MFLEDQKGPCQATSPTHEGLSWIPSNSHEARIHKKEDFSILRTVKENITTELLAFPIFWIVGQNGPVDPFKPQIKFFLVFF